MKKILYSILFLTITLNAVKTNAQAFSAKQINFTVGIGGAEYIQIGNSNNPLNPYTGANNWMYPSGQMVLSAEFGVHKYVGIGVFTGVGGFSYPSLYGFTVTNLSCVDVPIGVFGNFHFFQLIGDKQGIALADKLDVYVGLSVGSGAMIYSSTGEGGTTKAYPLVYAGPHVGVNYFFTDKIGINGQFGFGQTFAQAGLVVKLR